MGEEKEFAPFIRSFDSFKNEEIRSNFGGPAAQDDKGEDDLGKSPSPMNSSGTFSMNNSFGSSSNKSTDSDSSDKDMKQLSIPKIKDGPDCSELFIHCAVSPTKARTLLQKSGIKKTKKRNFKNFLDGEDASEVASGPPAKKAKLSLCENKN